MVERARKRTNRETARERSGERLDEENSGDNDRSAMEIFTEVPPPLPPVTHFQREGSRDFVHSLL